jgi:hypothetical protein
MATIRRRARVEINGHRARWPGPLTFDDGLIVDSFRLERYLLQNGIDYRCGGRLFPMITQRVPPLTTREFRVRGRTQDRSQAASHSPETD